MKRMTSWLAIFFLALSLVGCANRATARIDPTADLKSMKTMHVVKIPDETAGISNLIADDLRHRGYTVTTGTDKPSTVDAIVTYVDKWMWDMTMYLFELTITIREPKSDFPLATGNSLHGSLTRKSPPEMVEEVMSNIFKEVK
ncbi:MAG: hypothetical protein KGP14_04915 [Betaproteobacteria bacterium]|nr:hypothetical protein [Betaproteobacteria bacterium]